MNLEMPIRARELPAITIPASDFDRLAELVDSAPPIVAPYLRRELARARRELRRVGCVPRERAVRAIEDQAASSTAAGLHDSSGTIAARSGGQATP